MDLAVEDFTTGPPVVAHHSGRLRRDWPSCRRIIEDRLLYEDGTPMLYSDGTPLRWLGLSFLLVTAAPQSAFQLRRPIVSHVATGLEPAIRTGRLSIDLTAGEPTRVTD